MRTTQPYRKGLNRPPSPVLDRMLAGGRAGTAGAGKPLANAMRKGGNSQKRFVPRLRGNTRTPGY